MHDEQAKVSGAGPGASEDSRVLEGMLEVGGQVFLDSRPEGLPSSRQRAVIRGWEPGGYILVARDARRGSAYLRRDQPCVVRLFREGEIWGFHTQVLSNQVYANDRQIQVQWPDEIERIRIRNHDRVSLRAMCRASYPDGSFVEGDLLDLSAGGCRVLLHEDLVIGTPLYLSFALPAGNEVENRLATVRNRRPAPKAGVIYGFQFADIEDSERHGIDLFVARQLAGQRGEESPHPQVVLCSPNREDLRRLRGALQALGTEVIAAGTLLQLGRALDSGRTVALLVNTEQPRLPALEICLAVKEDVKTRDIPVIIYGGGAEADNQYRASGAYTCLAGLEDLAGLLRTLESVGASLLR